MERFNFLLLEYMLFWNPRLASITFERTKNKDQKVKLLFLCCTLRYPWMYAWVAFMLMPLKPTILTNMRKSTHHKTIRHISNISFNLLACLLAIALNVAACAYNYFECMHIVHYTMYVCIEQARTISLYTVVRPSPVHRRTENCKLFLFAMASESGIQIVYSAVK